MSRVLVCSCRVGEDKETHDSVLYLTCWKMPTYTSRGLLWYPKKDESLVNIVVRRSEKPQTFEQFRSVKPGALLEVFYGVNEATAKAFVDRFELIPGTDVHKVEDLYLHPKTKNAVTESAAPVGTGPKAAKKDSKDDLPF